jgi:hypothetical protein
LKSTLLSRTLSPIVRLLDDGTVRHFPYANLAISRRSTPLFVPPVDLSGLISPIPFRLEMEIILDLFPTFSFIEPAYILELEVHRSSRPCGTTGTDGALAAFSAVLRYAAITLVLEENEDFGRCFVDVRAYASIANQNKRIVRD